MILTAWRVVQDDEWLPDAFSGKGAAMSRHGRWNSQGTGIVYAAGSESLAKLEVLLYGLTAITDLPHVLFRIEFDDSLVEGVDIAGLAQEWRASPAAIITQKLGDAWVRESRTAVLRTPSVHSTSEPNYLFNPKHSDFNKIIKTEIQRFTFITKPAR